MMFAKFVRTFCFELPVHRNNRFIKILSIFRKIILKKPLEMNGTLPLIVLMPCTLLKVDGLELNCNGLIGPISESSSSSTIARDDRMKTSLLLDGDCSWLNNRFFRSDSLGVGSRRRRVLLLVHGVIFI